MKIRGRTVGTTMPRPDWNQRNPKKANFILNKPDGIVCDVSGPVVSVCDSSNQALHNLTLYGKTTQGGTPTMEAPVELVSVGDGGSVGVRMTNRNLIGFPFANTNYEANGLTFTANDDGSVTVNGTATKETLFTVVDTNKNTMYLPVGTYYFSGVPSGSFGGTSEPQFWVKNQSLGTGFGVYAGGKKVKVTTPALYSISIDIPEGNTLSNAVFKPMVNVGESPLPYEQPKTAQTLTVSTPNGLPGIDVPSGGNYTDVSGQNRICDTIEQTSGVHKHRIKTVILDGNPPASVINGVETTNGYRRYYYKVGDNDPAYRTRIMCSHFKRGTSPEYGVSYITSDGYITLYLPESMQDQTTATFKALLAENPVTFQYIMATPIETALSAEELAAYAALHTNKPNTTVYNDAGAGLKLAYNADTKTYIDNKFAELQNAILSAGANI